MRMRMAWVCFAALAAATAGAQTKVRFSDAEGAGDAGELRSSMAMTLQLKASSKGQTVGTFPVNKGEEEAYTFKTATVDADGKPTQQTRSYTVARESELGPDGQAKRSAKAWQGRTITLKRTGAATTVTAVGAALPADARKELTDLFGKNGPEEKFFPRRDVSPGETWSFPSAELARAFGGEGTATVEGRFVDVVQFAGHRCARIEVTLTVKATPVGAPISLAMALKGNVHYALDQNRTISAVVSGPITATGSQKEGDTSIDMEGNGTFSMKMTATYTAVGVRPAVR